MFGDDGVVPSAVLRSLLRRVSWVVVVDAELSMELGVFAALGVFAVDDSEGVDWVVVDSATRVCSCTVRC